jgi:DNA repair protein RadC
VNSDKPHYLGHRKRLGERFIKNGLEGFSNYEIVELLLTLAIPRLDVKEPAKALIARFGNLRGILDAPLRNEKDEEERIAVVVAFLSGKSVWHNHTIVWYKHTI